uniref:Solute carrier family 25 member 48 n=1 Tax=Lates calcarifer TaxID=8187 RepID=A0A4W6CVT4_LATCA
KSVSLCNHLSFLLLCVFSLSSGCRSVQCGRRPPAGHSEDAASGGKRLQEHAALCPHHLQEGDENLHLAGNVSSGTNIPLRSVNIPSQRLYRGPIHCISSILQTEGVQGLYRGAGAMILRDVPGYTLYFIPYTIFCDLLKSDAKSSPHPCSIWLAGGLAGSISWVTATPADVVKSRMQADAQLQRKYKGILHCIIHSYKTEGIQVRRTNTTRQRLSQERRFDSFY